MAWAPIVRPVHVVASGRSWLGLVSAFDGMIPLPGDYCFSGRFQSAVSSRLFERAPARN